MPDLDKRTAIQECFAANRFHPPSADAILNALHQAGWAIVPKAEAEGLVHLWRRCPDCGHPGAHHSFTDRAGESVGTRCG